MDSRTNRKELKNKKGEKNKSKEYSYKKRKQGYISEQLFKIRKFWKFTYVDKGNYCMFKMSWPNVWSNLLYTMDQDLFDIQQEQGAWKGRSIELFRQQDDT